MLKITIWNLKLAMLKPKIVIWKLKLAIRKRKISILKPKMVKHVKMQVLEAKFSKMTAPNFWSNSLCGASTVFKENCQTKGEAPEDPPKKRQFVAQASHNRRYPAVTANYVCSHELLAPMNEFIRHCQEPLGTNMLIPALEHRMTQAAKLRGAHAHKDTKCLDSGAEELDKREQRFKYLCCRLNFEERTVRKETKMFQSFFSTTLNRVSLG